MKKLLFCLIAFVAFSVVVSCDDDDTWKKYEEWRKINLDIIYQSTCCAGYVEFSLLSDSTEINVGNKINGRNKINGNIIRCI